MLIILNKKAFTTVEMILTIVLVIVLMGTITSVSLVYRDKCDYEETITNLTNFKNNLTKTIYSDILRDNNKITSTNKVSNNIYILNRETDPITLEVLESDSKYYLVYDDVKYLVPGSDNNLIEYKGIDYLENTNYSSLNINFLSLKTEELFTIHIIVNKK